MARGSGWRFLDLGRRIERGIAIAQTVRGVMTGPPSADRGRAAPGARALRCRPTPICSAIPPRRSYAAGAHLRARRSQQPALAALSAGADRAPSRRAGRRRPHRRKAAIVPRYPSTQRIDEFARAAARPTRRRRCWTAPRPTSWSCRTRSCAPISPMPPRRSSRASPWLAADRGRAMTRYAMRHETVYRYRTPVDMGLHVLRLTPLNIRGQRSLGQTSPSRRSRRASAHVRRSFRQCRPSRRDRGDAQRVLGDARCHGRSRRAARPRGWARLGDGARGDAGQRLSFAAGRWPSSSIPRRSRRSRIAPRSMPRPPSPPAGRSSRRCAISRGASTRISPIRRIDHVATKVAEVIAHAARRLPGFRSSHDLRPARPRPAGALCLGLSRTRARPSGGAIGRLRCEPCLGVAVVRRRARLDRVSTPPTISSSPTSMSWSPMAATSPMRRRCTASFWAAAPHAERRGHRHRSRPARLSDGAGRSRRGKGRAAPLRRAPARPHSRRHGAGLRRRRGLRSHRAHPADRRSAFIATLTHPRGTICRRSSAPSPTGRRSQHHPRLQLFLASGQHGGGSASHPPDTRARHRQRGAARGNDGLCAGLRAARRPVP